MLFLTLRHYRYVANSIWAEWPWYYYEPVVSVLLYHYEGASSLLHASITSRYLPRGTIFIVLNVAHPHSIIKFSTKWAFSESTVQRKTQLQCWMVPLQILSYFWWLYRLCLRRRPFLKRFFYFVCYWEGRILSYGFHKYHITPWYGTTDFPLYKKRLNLLIHVFGLVLGDKEWFRHSFYYWKVNIIVPNPWMKG